MAAPEIIRTQQYTSWLLQNASHVTGGVLDCGCGRMPYKAFFPESEWTGIDIRPVGDIDGDICEMDFAESFDTALCIDVLHQVPDPLAAVRKMAASLKPGGRLVLAARGVVGSDEGFFGFTSDGLVALCVQSGLKSGEDTYLGGGLFSSGHGENLYSNASRLGENIAEFDRYNGYLDGLYPAIVGVVALKE